MRITLLLCAAFLLLTSCGTQTSDGMDIDDIRDRLDGNACRINRENFIFQLSEIEFNNDTTYTEMPWELFPDSLRRCPVTGVQYEYIQTDDDRYLKCTSGHGETEF